MYVRRSPRTTAERPRPELREAERTHAGASKRGPLGLAVHETKYAVRKLRQN